MKKYLKLLKYLITENRKTIYFNFKYLPFGQAIHFPFILSNNVYLKKLEGKIVLECPVRYNLVTIGFGEVGIFDEKKARSIWQVSGKVIFKGRTLLGHGVKISVEKEGILTFGENFKLTAETAIVCHDSIEFGKNCLVSWDVLIMDTDSHQVVDKFGKEKTVAKPIVIGEHVWIGCRATVLKGVRIPCNSIIGAGSIVSGAFNIENAIYAGIPASIIRTNVNWK